MALDKYHETFHDYSSTAICVERWLLFFVLHNTKVRFVFQVKTSLIDAEANLGPVDLLFNCAGISHAQKFQVSLAIIHSLLPRWQSSFGGGGNLQQPTPFRLPGIGIRIATKRLRVWQSTSRIGHWQFQRKTHIRILWNPQSFSLYSLHLNPNQSISKGIFLIRKRIQRFSSVW